MPPPSIRILAAAAALLASGATAACTARSGPQTAVLVELYTAAACESCREADRRLAGLGRRYRSDAGLVAISVHLDDLDYASQDESARRRVARRQFGLAKMRRAIVYSPQVLLQGREFGQWASADFDDAVARVRALPSRADLRLTVDLRDSATVQVSVRSRLIDVERAGAVLYLATYEARRPGGWSETEDRPRSAGVEHVLRHWGEPIPFGRDGRLRVERQLALPPGAVPERSGVAAFVRAGGSRDVLQALMLPVCAGSGVR